jgi:hypothetical protein
MSASSDFGDYYKTISDADLLSILENPDDYQPEAIEAAKNELIARQLPDNVVNEVKETFKAKQVRKEKKHEKIKAIETKARNSGKLLIDTINPIQAGIPATEKIIRFIVIILTVMFLFDLVSEFRLLKYSILDFGRYPVENGFILFPFILSLIAIITFWKRKPVGWSLLAIFLAFTLILIGWELFTIINWHTSDTDLIIFQKPSLITPVTQLVFLAGMLYVICQSKIRSLYLISEGRAIGTIAITAVLSFLLVLAFS